MFYKQPTIGFSKLLIVGIHASAVGPHNALPGAYVEGLSVAPVDGKNIGLYHITKL